MTKVNHVRVILTNVDKGLGATSPSAGTVQESKLVVHLQDTGYLRVNADNEWALTDKGREFISAK